MKSTRPLLLVSICILFFGFSSQAQQKTGNYTDYDHGYYYYYYEKWDSAFLFFNRYVNNPDDTLKKGMAYNFMGEMQWTIGDLYGAQENLFNAVKTLDPLNKEHRTIIGYAYNILGNVSLDLKQYDEAIGFYNNSLSFTKGTDYLLEVMNGKATAFQKKKSYTNAIAVYDSILSLKPADQSLVARIIDNKARTKWLSNPGYPALPELQTALKIRVDSQYNMGLNASYAHLSDYYAKSNPDSALWYAQKMFDKAKENHSPEDVLEAIDKLIMLSSAPTVKATWFNEFKQLNDSLRLTRDTTRNRFALIRYDVQKSKADNLVLQQHISKQQLWMYGLLALAALIIAGLMAWYNKRRKRMAADAENTIRNARLRTSQKVHDVVANGLYGIMNELEHRNTIEREPLMAKIEVLYEKSRNISYEDMAPENTAGYNRQVHDLLTAFANEQTKLIIVGNEQTFWNNITSVQKEELQLLLNELMVNMKKHSQAKNVVLLFKQADNKVFVHYKDDGVGFAPGFRFGNGLNNTVSRINSLNGAINFGESEKGGAAITISFPLEPNNK